MRGLGDLLSRHLRQHDEGGNLYAAAVVAAVNQELRHHWSPQDALAATFQRGQAAIYVSHSAIAALVQQSATEIITAANQTLARQFPGLHEPVMTLITRANPRQ